MSTITNIPYVIDPGSISARVPDPGWASNLFAGPYEINGKVYAIQKDGATPNSPRIYSSPDGITWTLIETLIIGIVSYASTWFWDPLGPSPSVITFTLKSSAAPSTDTYYLQDYDCSTETLGSPYGVTGGPKSTTTGPGLRINRLSDGDVNLFIVKSDTLYYSHYDLGSDTWTAVDTSIFVNTGTAFSLRLLCCCTDRTVDGSAFIYEYEIGGFKQFKYRYLSSALVLAAAQSMSVLFPVAAGTSFNRMYQGGDDNIYVSELTYNEGNTASTGVGIWTISGADLSAPTLTETQIYNFDPGGIVGYNTVFSFANEAASQPCVLVTLQDPTLLPFFAQNVYVYRFTFDGASWSSPELLVDLVAYPPTTPPPRSTYAPYYYIEGLSWIESAPSAGDVGLLLALDIESAFGPNAVTAFAMVSVTSTVDCQIVVSPIDLASTCPLKTQIPVGIPYYAEIIVTGGVPPYTFALIAGAFPTGITLDTATGVISGTTTDPLADYSYTIRVTDADANTVDITCGITVGCPGMASRLVDGAAADPKLTASGSGGTTLRSLL